LSTVYAIKQAIVSNKGLQRKPGSSGQTKRTKKFLCGLLNEDGTTSHEVHEKISFEANIGYWNCQKGCEIRLGAEILCQNIEASIDWSFEDQKAGEMQGSGQFSQNVWVHFHNFFG